MHEKYDEKYGDIEAAIVDTENDIIRELQDNVLEEADDICILTNQVAELDWSASGGTGINWVRRSEYGTDICLSFLLLLTFFFSSISLASVAVHHHFVRPRVTSGSELMIRSGRHLLLEQRVAGMFQPNSTTIGRSIHIHALV